MKKLIKYLPYLMFIILIILIAEPKFNTLNYSWIGLVVLFIGIILLFEFIESSRSRRIKKWKDYHQIKITQILKFSILFGLPVPAIIIFLIHNKAGLINSIMFIAVPLVVLFGWIGLLDWQNCNKKNLEEKYNITLQK